MSKWETVKLGEVCKKITDGSHNPPSGVEQSQYLMLSSKNVENGRITLVEPRYLSKEDFIFENKRTEIEADDILLTIVGTIGRVALVPKELKYLTLQRSVAVLKPEKKHIISKYLMYVLQSMEKGLNQEARGVAQKGIYLSQVNKLEIPLPPLEEQKRIADILDKASKLTDLRKQQLEKMDLLIKSKFIDMFGDPVTNPKEWEVKKIGELTNVFTGATPNKSIDEYYCGNIPWVKTGEISKEYIWEAEERITKKALKETNCKIFPINTIMVAMYGQGKTRGQAGLLKIEASTNQACAAIVPNESYCTEYLFKLIQLSYETLRSLGRGGNQPNLNLSMIKEFLVMCPPVELQNQFAEFVEQVEKQKAVMQQSLEKMETNYKALMQEYFG